MATLTLNESNPVTTTGSMQPIAVNPGTGPSTFNTAYQVITMAMRNAALLDKLQDPDSDDLAEYMPRLNHLINFEMTQGLKLWLEQDVSWYPILNCNCYQFGLTVTNTVPGTYFIVPKPLRVKEMYWQDNSGNRRPLISLSRNDFDMLGTVTTNGPINSYFVDKQQNFLNVWLWLTPDVYSSTQGQAHAIFQVMVNQLVSLTDSMNFPVEWFQFLQWALAAEIDTGQPKEITDTCDKMAVLYRQAVEDWDVEDASTSFAPDSRLQYASNRFA